MWWVAREKDDELSLWSKKPHRHYDDPEDKDDWWWDGDFFIAFINKNLFRELKQTDEPIKVVLTRK